MSKLGYVRNGFHVLYPMEEAATLTIQQFATQRALSPLALAQHKWDETMQVRRRKNLSALTGSGWCCSKRLRLAVEAASGSALT